MGVDAQMLVRVPRPLLKGEVRHLAFDLSSCFGHDHFLIDREGKYGPRHHAIKIVKAYIQDGPTLKPNKGEQFLEVQLAGRYYGEGYERGDLPLYISIAEWFEYRVPSCEVWYGGDSSGVLAKPFDAAARNLLFQHFAFHARRPYLTGFSMRPTQSCDFCVEPMWQQGSGAYEMWRCEGCGYTKTSRDGGKTWTWKQEKE